MLQNDPSITRVRLSNGISAFAYLSRVRSDTVMSDENTNYGYPAVAIGFGPGVSYKRTLPRMPPIRVGTLTGGIALPGHEHPNYGGLYVVNYNNGNIVRMWDDPQIGWTFEELPASSGGRNHWHSFVECGDNGRVCGITGPGLVRVHQSPNSMMTLNFTASLASTNAKFKSLVSTGTMAQSDTSNYGGIYGIDESDVPFRIFWNATLGSWEKKHVPAHTNVRGDIAKLFPANDGTNRVFGTTLRNTNSLKPMLVVTHRMSDGQVRFVPAGAGNTSRKIADRHCDAHCVQDYLDNTLVSTGNHDQGGGVFYPNRPFLVVNLSGVNRQLFRSYWANNSWHDQSLPFFPGGNFEDCPTCSFIRPHHMIPEKTVSGDSTGRVFGLSSHGILYTYDNDGSNNLVFRHIP